MSLQSNVLEGSIGENLRSALKAIADESVGGYAVFRNSDCRKLNTSIVCRVYWKKISDLCHLVVVARACFPNGGWEQFFWSNRPSRTEQFKALVGQRLVQPSDSFPKFIVSSGSVKIHYRDEILPPLYYQDFSFLSALLHFLVEIAGHQTISKIFDDMLRNSGSTKAIVEARNELNRELYKYLGDNLPSSQHQKSQHKIIKFLKKKLGDDCSFNALEEDILVEFWRRESQNDAKGTQDFKLFSTVFNAFGRIADADRAGRQIYRMGEHVHKYEDRSGPECDDGGDYFNAEIMAEAIAIAQSKNEILQQIEEDILSEIKFLNQSELNLTKTLWVNWELITQLPLSRLRADVFCAAQSVISQSKRRHIGNSNLSEKIDNSIAENYTASKKKYMKLAAHIDRMLLASLYALIYAKDEYALTIISELRPEIDILRGGGEKNIQVSKRAEVINLFNKETEFSDRTSYDEDFENSASEYLKKFLELLTGPNPPSIELAQLVEEAKKSYKLLSRIGFMDEPHPGWALQDQFREGAIALLALRSDLTKFLKNIDAISDSGKLLDTQFEIDEALFIDQFHQIYGVAK